MGYEAGGVWIFPCGAAGLTAGSVKHINQAPPASPGRRAGRPVRRRLAAGDITGTAATNW
jgi:hypothetical protein